LDCEKNGGEVPTLIPPSKQFQGRNSFEGGRV